MVPPREGLKHAHRTRRANMHFSVSLTVSESKRLIAKGVASDSRVESAMRTGRVCVLPGTTNGYVLEELIQAWPDVDWKQGIGSAFDKLTFVSGRTLPRSYTGPKIESTMPAVFIHHGEVTVTTSSEAVEQMEAGDVFIKGVNAINYERRQAGVLIGHPKGGNVGEAIGPIVARRICFLHPAGLEKNVCGDLEKATEMIDADPDGKGPTLWLVPGPIFTEIEALEVLTGTQAVPVASGGVGGAEGAVWLSIFGDESALARARECLEGIRGEPSFTAEPGVADGE
jgi:hypothetical protein